MRSRVLVAAWLAAAACDGAPAEPRDALAAGWIARFDAPNEEPPGAPRFLQHAGCVEVMPGPNVNLWHRDHSASGSFRLSLDVTHLDSGMHPHGAGLAFGGSDVHGATQRYTYFLVRGDQHFLIKVRAAEDTPDVVSWTQHAAVAREDEKGVARNRLSVEARAADVRFLVNGTEVHRSKRSELPVDGQYGLRIVHDLHVRFGMPVVERIE